MSHQNVSSKSLFKMSHQNVSSNCLIKIYNPKVSLKFLIKMSHQNISSICLIKGSQQNVQSKCPIKISHQNGSYVFSVGKKGQENMFSSQRIFLYCCHRIFQKKNFLSVRIYSSSINSYSINHCNTKEKNILQLSMFLQHFP